MSGASGMSALTFAGVLGFNPATLPFEGWWRIPYAAPMMDPRWSGTASAGGSGSRTLVRDVDVDPIPTVGATLNGRATADFDKASGQALETAVDASNFIAAGAWSLGMWVKVHSTAATSGAGFLDPAIFCDRNNKLAATFSTSGVRFEFNDGSNKAITPIACSTGAWHFLQAKGNGTNAYGRVDGGAWQSVGCGNLASLAGKFVFGKMPGVDFVDFELAEAFLAATAFTDGTFDALKASGNAYHGLSV